CRASTSLSTPKKDVDGRDKPGHDDERESSAADLQPHFFPRTALRFRGNDESFSSQPAQSGAAP
ncbi:MAG TPA: hypothetical protein VN518_03570, partial [Methyloceanibacter sp.]|nr:hypothetical protein [Methyloceanibacter sp.]